MEKIGLHNYEAYFLDYLEGNLSFEEEQRLLQFVELYPELAAELDLDLAALSLHADNTQIGDKKMLKFTNHLLDIDIDTIEEEMIAAIEGQLDDKDLSLFTDYMQANDLETEFNYYKATLLKPNLNDKYPFKNELKKRGGIILPLYAKFAAAAAVAIILISVALNFQNPSGVFQKNEFISSTIERSSVKGPFEPLIKTAFKEKLLQSYERTSNTKIILDSEPKTLAKKESNLISQGKEKEVIQTLKIRETRRIDNSAALLDLPDLVALEPVFSNENAMDEFEDVALLTIQSEQPYKVFTDVAGDVIRRDVSFMRDKNMETSEYVGFRFKIGNFEFERKKAK
jgi:hypothetical protein